MEVARTPGSIKEIRKVKDDAFFGLNFANTEYIIFEETNRLNLDRYST